MFTELSVYCKKVTWQKRKTIKKTKMKKRQPSPHSSIKLPLFGSCHIYCFTYRKFHLSWDFCTHFLFVEDVVSFALTLKGATYMGAGGHFNRAHEPLSQSRHEVWLSDSHSNAQYIWRSPTLLKRSLDHHGPIWDISKERCEQMQDDKWKPSSHDINVNSGATIITLLI